MTLPAAHTAGDTFVYTASLAAYPASAAWVGKLRLVPRAAGGAVIELTAAAAGNDHAFTASAATTSAWAAGDYAVVQWVEKAGEVHTTDTGQLTVAPDPRTIAVGTDTRSIARRTLADLIAARSTWATTQGRTRRYKIGDREREFASAAELNQEIAFWQGQLAVEDNAARLAAGLAPKNRILTRFTRPR